MKVLSKYLLPAILVAGFLFFFIQDAFFDHYRNPDDCAYDGLVRKFGVVETIKLLFWIDTGRWFSHLVCAPAFYFLGHDFFRYGIFLCVLLGVFLASVAYCYKIYARTFLKRADSFFSRLKFALILTSTLYFLLFAGRMESFGWVSGALNHLLSVSLCLFLLGMLFRERSTILHSFLVFVVSLFVGGSNEVNAICMITGIACLVIIKKVYLPSFHLSVANMIASVIAISAGLTANVMSGGYAGRMSGLPDFTVYQSLKNTVHSFLMPFLQYMYLPAFLGALVVFILYLKEKDHRFHRKILTFFAVVAGLIVLSYFLNCFILSDVVPARAMTWGYTAALLTIGFYLRSHATKAL